MISSWVPSNRIWAKSWVPDEEISGMLIPHGEAYSINEYFTDKETGILINSLLSKAYILI
jgi:homospermidine synthase